MLKRSFAFLLMALAYAILLGHSIVPHHHHDEHSEFSGHDHLEHHDEDGEHGGLNHLFSHFVHASDEITFTNSSHFNSAFSNQLLTIVTVNSEQISFKHYLLPPLEYKPPADFLICSSPFIITSSLRGPPSFNV